VKERLAQPPAYRPLTRPCQACSACARHLLCKASACESDNIETVRAICIAMSDNVREARAMCAWLWERALTIARANADDIRAVADALIERHSLDTEAFENILGDEERRVGSPA
jgi:hypothetical protein